MHSVYVDPSDIVQYLKTPAEPKAYLTYHRTILTVLRGKVNVLLQWMIPIDTINSLMVNIYLFILRLWKVLAFGCRP